MCICQALQYMDNGVVKKLSSVELFPEIQFNMHGRAWLSETILHVEKCSKHCALMHLIC